MLDMKPSINQKANSRKNSGLALFFFLLGAPQLYLFFNRHSDEKSLFFLPRSWNKKELGVFKAQ